MKMKKRVLSVLLCFAMVLAWVPAAYAQEAGQEPDGAGGGEPAAATAEDETEQPQEPAEEPAEPASDGEAGTGTAGEDAAAAGEGAAPSADAPAAAPETTGEDTAQGTEIIEGQARFYLWGNEGFSQDTYEYRAGLDDTFMLEYPGGEMSRFGASNFGLLGYGRGDVFAVPEGTTLEKDALLAAAVPLESWAADGEGIKGIYFPDPWHISTGMAYRVVFQNRDDDYFVVSQPIRVMDGRVDNGYENVRESRARVMAWNRAGEWNLVHNGWDPIGPGYLDFTDAAEVEFFEGYPCQGDFIDLFLVPASVPLVDWELQSNAIHLPFGWNSTGYDTQTVGDIHLEHLSLAGEYRFVVRTVGNMLVVSQPVAIGEEGGAPPEQNGDQFSRNGLLYEVLDMDAREVTLLGYGEDYSFEEEWVDLTVPSTVQIGGMEFRVRSIAERAFEYIGFHRDVVIEEGIESIGDYAFFNCHGLRSVSIPASVSAMGLAPFNACYDLVSLTVDAGNRRYVSRDDVLFTNDGRNLICYAGAKEGRRYVVPDTVVELGYSAFANNHLEELILNEGLEMVYGSALGGDKLRTLHIPASLTGLSYASFFSASSLQGLTVAEGNPSFKAVDNVLFSKDGLTLIYYPEGMPAEHYAVPEGTERIGTAAFWRSAIPPGQLKSVTLPDSLTYLGNMAFRANGNLESINIPAGLTALNPQAFTYCRSLREVRCASASAPSIGNLAFLEISSEATLYIPAGARADYEARGWMSHFKYVEEVDGPEVTLSGLEITTPPDRLAYRTGEALDLSGLEVSARYSDGSTRTVDSYTTTPAAGTALDAGNKTVTVAYAEGDTEVEAGFDITVAAPVLTGITLAAGPDTTKYHWGDAFSGAGLRVLAQYDVGEPVDVTGEAALDLPEGYLFTEADDGEVTVEVRYTEDDRTETADFALTVAEGPVSSVTLASSPDKTEYRVGDTFSPAGAQLLVGYENGYETLREPDAAQPQPLQLTAAGSYTFLLRYGDLGAEVGYTVKNTPLAGLTIERQPNKTEYGYGETLDYSGIVIHALYEAGEGDAYTVDVTDAVTFSPGPGEAVADVNGGNLAVTASYTEEGLSAEATFELTVLPAAPVGIEVTTLPAKTQYQKGETLALDGLVVSAVLPDDSRSPVEGYTTSPAAGAPLDVGDTQVTVEAPQPVTLNGLEVSKLPGKTSYSRGDRLSLAGMAVTAVYSDGSRKAVTGYTTSPADGSVLSSAGSQPVIVTYVEDGVTAKASFNAEVKAPANVFEQIVAVVKTVVNTVINWFSRLFR